MNNKLTYERIKDIVIIHFPETYFVGNWGEMLELVRFKKILEAKYIIIDLSNVKYIDDCGGEFYILRKEFKEIGGKDVILSGMPEAFQKIFKHIEDKIDEEKIRRYNIIDDAIKSIE